jgi:hypothetical protein
MEAPDVYIFVCGSSRSGTTMMSRVLGNHSKVFGFQELHFFDELLPSVDVAHPIPTEKAIHLLSTLKSIQRDGYFGPRDWRKYVDESQHQLSGKSSHSIELLLEFLKSESERNGKCIPCEQTPQSVFAMDTILQHVPNARFVVMVRDPREVLLSQKGKWKRRKLSGGQIPWLESVRSRINYHPALISRIWKATYEATLRHEHDPRVLMLRYEDLTENPEATVIKICTHIGLTYEPAMLDVPRVGSSNVSDVAGVRGIDKTLKGKWQSGLNDGEVAICEKINGIQMLRFGYVASSIKGSWWLTLFYTLILPFQITMAVFLNLKRLRHFKKHLTKFFSRGTVR